MTRDWWRGTLIVGRRTAVENVRSTSFKVLTLLVLLLGAAAVTVPQLIGDDTPSYQLATVGEAPAELRTALEAAAEATEFELELIDVDDEEAARTAVRDGTATVALVGDRLYTSVSPDATFAAVVSQTVVALETSRLLVDAGLSQEQLERLAAVTPPEQVPVESEQEQARSGVAFATGIVLYLAITFAGSAIATAVATEKSSRISEVLLALLRPSQTLVGTVGAVGLLALVQLLVAAVPLAVGVRVSDDLGLPSATSSDLALGVAWFFVGFALYAFLFAASAALVDKVTEVSSALIPVNGALLVSYLLALMVVGNDPRGATAVAVSLFPLSAPIAMPIRWATGEVPAFQLALAFALAILTALLMVRIAAIVYGRALVVTGRRLDLKEAWRLARGND